MHNHFDFEYNLKLFELIRNYEQVSTLYGNILNIAIVNST